MFSLHALRKAVEADIEREIKNRFLFTDINAEQNTYKDARKLVDLKFRGMLSGKDLLIAVLWLVFIALSIGLMIRIFYHLENPILSQVAVLGGAGYCSVGCYYVRQRIILARQEVDALLRSNHDYWRSLLTTVEKTILDIRNAKDAPSHW